MKVKILRVQLFPPADEETMRGLRKVELLTDLLEDWQKKQFREFVECLMSTKLQVTFEFEGLVYTAVVPGGAGKEEVLRRVEEIVRQRLRLFRIPRELKELDGEELEIKVKEGRCG